MLVISIFVRLSAFYCPTNFCLKLFLYDLGVSLISYLNSCTLMDSLRFIMTYYYDASLMNYFVMYLRYRRAVRRKANFLTRTKKSQFRPKKLLHIACLSGPKPWAFASMLEKRKQLFLDRTIMSTNVKTEYRVPFIDTVTNLDMTMDLKLLWKPHIT